ncbi:MAG: hypothetical protein AAB340_03095 [Patescibacteria group bacterium]
MESEPGSRKSTSDIESHIQDLERQLAEEQDKKAVFAGALKGARGKQQEIRKEAREREDMLQQEIKDLKKEMELLKKQGGAEPTSDGVKAEENSENDVVINPKETVDSNIIGTVEGDLTPEKDSIEGEQLGEPIEGNLGNLSSKKTKGSKYSKEKRIEIGEEVLYQSYKKELLEKEVLDIGDILAYAGIGDNNPLEEKAEALYDLYIKLPERHGTDLEEKIRNFIRNRLLDDRSNIDRKKLKDEISWDQQPVVLKKEEKGRKEAPKEVPTDGNQEPIVDPTLKELEQYLDTYPKVEKLKFLDRAYSNADRILNILESGGEINREDMKKYFSKKDLEKFEEEGLTPKRVEYLKKQCRAIKQIVEERRSLLKGAGEEELKELGKKILQKEIKEKINENQKETELVTPKLKEEDVKLIKEEAKREDEAEAERLIGGLKKEKSPKVAEKEGKLESEELEEGEYKKKGGEVSEIFGKLKIVGDKSKVLSKIFGEPVTEEEEENTTIWRWPFRTTRKLVSIAWGTFVVTGKTIKKLGWGGMFSPWSRKGEKVDQFVNEALEEASEDEIKEEDKEDEEEGVKKAA